MSKLKLGRISKVGIKSTKVARVSLGSIIKKVTNKILGEGITDNSYMDAEYEVIEAPKTKYFSR